MHLWYYKLLALHPKWVWLVVVILSIILMVLSIALKDLPEFTDPALVRTCFIIYLIKVNLIKMCFVFLFFFQKGFETRGTDIASRLTAWGNLIEETRSSGPLTANPHDIVYKAMVSCCSLFILFCNTLLQ